MKWTYKAKIQRAASVLPSKLSYSVYYWMQRNFGGLRNINPMTRFQVGLDCWKKILSAECKPEGATFLEIGTGRVPVLPMAFWLLGAGRIVTLDLNPYLSSELTKQVHQFIVNNEDAVRQLFGESLVRKRFDELLAFPAGANFCLQDFLGMCHIEYIAPADAAETDLADASIDFHMSYNVLEHIPHDMLIKIILEGNRIIKKEGLFVHRIDYSDHFSHTDKSISAINFFQFSDKEWEKYSGNRYMYMNRMRHDDFIELFQMSGHRILLDETEKDPNSMELLMSNSIRLNDKFSIKTIDTLSTVSSWIVSAPRDAQYG